MRQSTVKSGFTFIEISIVITIIGLLVGGVMLGMSLKRAAEVRAVLGEVERTTKAIGLFKEKYNQLPGDMYNATNFWGADAGCPGVASNTVPKRETCNGNGNGRIGYVTTAGGVDGTAYEMFRAWQHLSNGGFVQQKFSGTTGAGGVVSEFPGIHNQASDMTGVGWSLGFLDGMAGSVDFYPAVYGNRLAFGRRVEGAGGNPSWLRGPFLATEEALSIDQKVDDGKPGQGKVLGYKPAAINTACTTGTNPETAAYNTANAAANTCSLLVVTGY